MPYRHAWFWCLATLAVTAVAFWPGYFSQLGTAKVSSHVHAVTATAWILLIAAQSWAIDTGRRTLHRSLGLAIFVMVPLFFVGGVCAMHSMAIATGSGQDVFYNVWGPSLGSYDLVAALGFLALTAMALKDRRRVAHHSGWLLATPLLLVGPILSRIYPRYVPGLSMQGPQDFEMFRWGIHLGGLTAIAIALWLWSRRRRDGAPWLVAAAINLTQLFLFETLGFTVAWKIVFVAFGHIPIAMLSLGAAIAAAVALRWGWRAVPARRTGLAEAKT
ncbi:hypothetical protein [Blastomonas sp.]|uniref:hypothetical protein n=1 Tax=Blastomonas sp. TaxID=1909299 RepID=UPI00262CB4E0|nr:hypothetical protein [Blastomonas sp.]MDM7957554.1 hypothetical protein [Blastomonas sp.]